MRSFKFKKRALACVAATAMLLGVGPASAHVIAIGYSAGANAGEVNLWLGSYHTYGQGDGPDLEGSAQLQGLGALSSYLSVTPFTYSEGTNGSSTALPPTGLTLGTNLFTSVNYGGSATSQSALNDVYSWEAATVSGLSAGDYVFTYVPVASPSQHWTPWSDLQNITLTLTAAETSGGGTTAGAVPEPATLAIFGVGLIGIRTMRRRRKAA